MIKWKFLGACIILVSIIIPLSTFAMYKIEEKNYAVVLEKHLEENDYFAILEIESIALKRELYEINSKENNVNKNIFVHKKSIFPDQKNSYIILAAHSGNGHNAYFQDLYKLQLKDEIKLYYDNYIWIYEIIDIEYQNKTGILYLKEENEDMITLITCTKNNSTTQTIYYGILKNKEKIAQNI